MKKDGQSTVFWWVGWIVLTILTFFVSCWFWTGFLARQGSSMDKPGAPLIWVAAVFGTWIVFLIPLIVVMYAKVDKAYEDTRLQREAAALEKAKANFKIRSIFIDESKRRLGKELQSKLKRIPEAIHRGHLVTASLKDGRKIENVFILGKKEMLGVYDKHALDFDASDIIDLTPADLDRLPPFKAENWLRLDGVGMPISN